MVSLILYLLACYATWFVISQSDLPLWGSFRDEKAFEHPMFAKFILCPVCSGFWVSAALALLWPLHSEASVSFLGPFIQALGGTAAVFLIETHVRRSERA